MYKRLEGFQCEYDPTASVGSLKYAKLDNEIQACLNNISEFQEKTVQVTGSRGVSVDTEVNMYQFNGSNSNIYIRDYYDNYIAISFVIELSMVKDCTIVHTKHIRVYIDGGTLMVAKDGGSGVAHTYKTTLATGTLYELKLNNDKTSKHKIEFGGLGTDLEIYEFDIDTTCEFTIGNDIYIGCNRTTTSNSYMNGFIGVTQLDINKSKWDEFEYTENPHPSEIVCDTGAGADAGGADAGGAGGGNAAADSSKTDDYITITCDLRLQDLQRKFKSNKTNEHKGETTLDAITTFFASLDHGEELFTNFTTATLYKYETDAFFKDAYHNHDSEPTSTDIYYMFSYNDNFDIVNTFDFLDQSQIKNINSNYEQVYIFIYGERTEQNSAYQFLRLQKPIFIIVYKNESDSVYYFEPIKMNLDKFYEYHLKYSIYHTTTIDTSPYTTFFATQPEVDTNIDIVYTTNFYRKYQDKIDVGDINVTVFKNSKQTETLLVRYKKDKTDNECTFTARGETKFDCIQGCDDFSTGCNKTKCRILCDSCDTNRCKWNLIDINMKHRLSPSDIRLKGFAGDKKVKITWIKPLSPYSIETYYIMSSSALNTHFDLYVYEGTENMIEFYITDLTNDIPYSFYVFSKNKVGISEPSNRATVIPQKNKLLKMENVSKNTFSDSLQNYYKSIESSDDDGGDDSLTGFNKTISNMNMLDDVNKLKDILVYKITENKLSSDTNINIF
jgi:hypothetical protein